MREIIISKHFVFDAAHNLTSYNGKCERLHGHTYHLEVAVKGVPDEEGMVIDFSLLKKIVKENIVDKLDHLYINEILDVSPSAENILYWMVNILEPILKTERYRLYKITLWETADNKAELVLE